MNPLLEQFLGESREFLQGIGEKLIQLESSPDDPDLMNELFRYVHTLKGNSGLFDFPEMTRVLHAAEDLMMAVRNGKIAYTQRLADELLNAMDFVGYLCDEVESTGVIDASNAAQSATLTEAIRAMLVETGLGDELVEKAVVADDAPLEVRAEYLLARIPEAIRIDAFTEAMQGGPLYWICYKPIAECFFQGDDPLYVARRTPGALWGHVQGPESWGDPLALDAYQCVLEFYVLSNAPLDELQTHYRYVMEQVSIVALPAVCLVLPQGEPNGGPVYEDFVSEALELLQAGQLERLREDAQAMLELSNAELWFASALRWLVLVIKQGILEPLVIRDLIVSLRSLQVPVWSKLLQSGDLPTIVPDQPNSKVPSDENLTAEPVDTPASVIETSGARSAQSLDISEEDYEALQAILAKQKQILLLQDRPSWIAGRWTSVAETLINCFAALGDHSAKAAIGAALTESIARLDCQALLDELLIRQSLGTTASAVITDIAPGAIEDTVLTPESGDCNTAEASAEVPTLDTLIIGDDEPDEISLPKAPTVAPVTMAVSPVAEEASGRDDLGKFARRGEDHGGGNQSLRVDQVKIDRLMNLIGEIVVAKNALPYLAQRAEVQFGVRELSREIKSQYSVINRIAEEMQDAIMQVRMRPVSFVFQRFPRLVRDITRKLGKEVNLVLEGEDTEADKNIIEALADPLIHIVRNSLDHGIERPEVRIAAGKPATGTLTIRAGQEADQVIIEIIDDGKGIDPDVVKRKAYESGVIDEAMMERLTDHQAINLIFSPGLSTAETISDLSGRGVGMDVVRSAVLGVNGNIQLDSVVGQGTQIRISLPLSMAVTKVMIIESDQQIFGVPMDAVVETVRLPRSAIRRIKSSQTAVLRGQIVALKTLNGLLQLEHDQITNEDDELAVLVVRTGAESVGLVVDDFRETIDVIQKPLAGVLGSLTAYSGSALMGDGSVLMILNVKEMIYAH